MFPKYRHAPITDPDRKRCPVCNSSVYSLAGIHPQCALNRALAVESRTVKQAAAEARLAVAEALLDAGPATPVSSAQPGAPAALQALGPAVATRAGFTPIARAVAAPCTPSGTTRERKLPGPSVRRSKPVKMA